MTFEAMRPGPRGPLLVWFIEGNLREWSALIPHGSEDAERIPDQYIDTPQRNRAAFDEWWRQYRGVFKPEERQHGI